MEIQQSLQINNVFFWLVFIFHEKPDTFLNVKGISTHWRIMPPRKKDAWTDADWISMISDLFLELWGKSESPIFPQNRICFSKSRMVSLRNHDAWTDTVYNFKKYYLVLGIWGKIGNGQSIRRPFWYFPPNRTLVWK